MKTVFPTQEAAHKSALDLKINYPMLQVKVYDAAQKTRTLVELPSDKVAYNENLIRVDNAMESPKRAE